MEIWETIGFWHYPIPGFFLLAQFSLGFLVAVGNLVNNSVFLYLSGEEGQSSSDDYTMKGEFSHIRRNKIVHIFVRIIKRSFCLKIFSFKNRDSIFKTCLYC